MLPTLALFTLLILLATLLPLLHSSHWVIRGLDFPRLQFAVLAAVMLVAHFLFLDTRLFITQLLIFITIMCLSFQLWWILPYTFLWPKDVKTTSAGDACTQLSVLTSNVLERNRNSDALIDLVKKYQPDVLVTLESNHWWGDKLKVLESEMPYSVKCPLENRYGMHLFSRLPLGEQEICYFIQKNVPSIHVSIELRTGDKVAAHFLHPAPPSPTENPRSANRDAELVIVARSVAQTASPVIVAGDLNDVAWSATTRLFRKISGLLDPRVGRGMFNTFHANHRLVRWPLDHLFHSHHFTLTSIQRLPSIGSDHFPLLARLSFTRSQDTNHGLQAEASDYERAEEIADQQNASENDVPKPVQLSPKTRSRPRPPRRTVATA